MRTNEWQRVTLGEIAAIERSAVAAKNIRSGTSYVGLEHIENGGELSSGVPVESGQLASTKFRFSNRHILYGKLRPYLAKIACPDFDGICSTDIVPILPGPSVSRRFLLHFLRQPEVVSYANSRATGVNLPRVSPSVLAQLELPLPPLVEQRRIAAVLDQAEALRAKRRVALAHVETLGQAVFREMFGDQVTSPKRWPAVSPLGDLAEIRSGITKGRKTGAASVRSVPYLAVANVQDKALDLSFVKSIDATALEIERYRLIRDDLLLTEGGDPDKLGRGTLWREELAECIHQNHIFRVRIHDRNLTPLYLNWLVASDYGKRYFLNPNVA